VFFVFFVVRYIVQVSTDCAISDRPIRSTTRDWQSRVLSRSISIRVWSSRRLAHFKLPPLRTWGSSAAFRDSTRTAVAAGSTLPLRIDLAAELKEWTFHQILHQIQSIRVKSSQFLTILRAPKREVGKRKNPAYPLGNAGFSLIGPAGFEPTTSTTPR
jgi:hypothetical protein